MFKQESNKFSHNNIYIYINNIPTKIGYTGYLDFNWGSFIDFNHLRLKLSLVVFKGFRVFLLHNSWLTCSVCVYIYTYVHLHVCLHLHIYMYVCVYLYTYIYLRLIESLASFSGGGLLGVLENFLDLGKNLGLPVIHHLLAFFE